MSFKPIRTFLTERLLEVDPEFEVYDQGFDSQEVGMNDFNKRFHIFYGSVITQAANQNTTQDVVSATVSLFFQGGRNSTEALDEAMDISNKYRINCIKRMNYAGLTFIKNVVCQSIEAAPIAESNDNAIKIQLKFSVSVIFGTGIDLNC